MWKRLVAMLAICAVMSVGLISYTNNNGTRSDGLYYQASGIRPDARIMTVNGQSVTAEEYLYWLDSSCQYLDAYVGGGLDFDAQVTEEMTFGQYAKSDAANTVTLYALVRQMAAEADITLTEADLTALETVRQQYVAYYGGEEAYHRQLQLLGANEEFVMSLEEVPYLYNRMYQEFASPEGKLYPGLDQLQEYAEKNGFITAQLLYFPIDGLDAQAVQDTADKAADYARQLRESTDRLTTYKTLATQLGLTVSDDGFTFSAAEVGEELYLPVAALASGEVSDVITTDVGYYVALRIDTVYESLAQELFNIRLQDRQDSAKVVYNERLYDSIDAGVFYAALQDARAALSQTLTDR